MTYEQDNSAGFTLMEVVTVCAIVGVVGLLAFPNMVRFQQQQQTRAGATQMAGLLDDARSRATTEATPYLVYFNEQTVDGNGNCGPAATIVRDSDRTYSLTAGDESRDVALPKGRCETLREFGSDPVTTFADLLLPLEDLSLRALDLALPGGNGNSGNGNSGNGNGNSGNGNGNGNSGNGNGNGNSGNGNGNSNSNGNCNNGNGNGNGNGNCNTNSTAIVADAVVNGATFPIDAGSGRPVIAFSERGIPVDPANPTSWGSGAGAIYMSDGRSTVYAAVVQPLGNVQLRVYDHVSGQWR